MPINAHPEYLNAEKKFNEALTDDERIRALEDMLKYMPKHKSAEALRKNLRTRYKKLKEQFAKKSKKQKSKKGIKKGELQAVLIGLTNAGKSSILNSITNANSKIASYGFTTTKPELGSLLYRGYNIQMIDLPPIASENFEYGLINSADLLIIIIERIDEVKTIMDLLKNTKKNKLIVFNKIDLYDENTKRKITENLRSKKYNFVIISTKTKEGIEKLKEKISQSFDIIRIYTRKPGKEADSVPVIVKPDSTLEQVAEKILHGYSKRIKFAKIWGPSSKFNGQRIGLKHIVKDNDIIEFYTD